MSKKQITLILTGSLILILVSAALALPQAFNLSWWTIDGGGGTSQGGGYTLSATIGQTEAGTLMSGDVYTLAGGYWGAGAPYAAGANLFLPLVIR